MTPLSEGAWVEGKVRIAGQWWSQKYEVKSGYVEYISGVYCVFRTLDGEMCESPIRTIKVIPDEFDNDMKNDLINLLLDQSKDARMKPYCKEWFQELTKGVGA